MNATSRLYSDVIGQLKKHFRTFTAVSVVIVLCGLYLTVKSSIYSRARRVK